MKNQIRILYIFAVVAFLPSCNSTPDSLNPEQYLSWVSSNKRAFNKTNRIKNVDIKMRYLPADYLAYKEFITSDSGNYDSLRKSYQCGITFQLSIQADKTDRTYSNLMYYNVSSPEEMMVRTRYLNFSINDFISAEHNKIKYEPVLSHFEGYDALGNRLNFQVVFIIPEYNCGLPGQDFNNVIVTLDDPFWDLGTNKFEFENKVLLSLPKMKF